MFKKMFKSIVNFFKYFADTSIPPLTSRDQIFLDQATDTADLERRIKEIEYRASRSRRLCY